MVDKNILIESISDERTSDSGVPARATYPVDATVAGDSLMQTIFMHPASLRW
jgi:hypothetical protein